MIRKVGRRTNFFILIIAILLMGMAGIRLIYAHQTEQEEKNREIVKVASSEIDETKQISQDWKLILVNRDNPLPENYEITLVNIDKERQFDARAIDALNSMRNAMIEDGVKGAWIQSAYRSVEKQKEVFNKKIKQYQKQGKTKQQAEELAQKTVNKPGYSEHNLGLAVDFNYVEGEFEQTQAFKWLMKYADEYGFILRYPKDKEEITKVEYEPWHWRYVGEEAAKEIKQKGICLEEYLR